MADEAAGPGLTRTIKTNPTELFAIADELAQRGQTRQAERILTLLSRDPSRQVRNEALYRQSLLLEKAGAASSAAVLLRKILDDQPDAIAVRLKLASMLHALGNEESALRELRAVRSADLPIAVARYVDRVSASLQASKAFGVQLEFALAPDSNINRATGSDKLGTIFGDFTFDKEAQRKSGLGVALRGLAQRRLILGRDLSVVARASSDLSLYPNTRYHDISAELSVGPEFRLVRTRFTAEAAVGQRWYGMKSFQRQFRLAGSASRALSSVSQGRVEASVRWSDNQMNDLQDGRGLTVRARYERALTPQMSLSASVTADRFKARDDAYSTHSWAAGLTAYRDIGRTSFNLGVEVGRLTADARLELLPAAREDRLMRLSLGAVFRQFTVAGFAPMTRVIVERNRSNIAFYDYKRTRTEFGVTRAF
jgi:hypothetical protein